jgi:hypothetical protein
MLSTSLILNRVLHNFCMARTNCASLSIVGETNVLCTKCRVSTQISAFVEVGINGELYLLPCKTINIRSHLGHTQTLNMEGLA